MRLLQLTACSSSRRQTSESRECVLITKTKAPDPAIASSISACHDAVGGMSSQSIQTSLPRSLSPAWSR